jgi:hypothetical protein
MVYAKNGCPQHLPGFVVEIFHHPIDGGFALHVELYDGAVVDDENVWF